MTIATGGGGSGGGTTQATSSTGKGATSTTGTTTVTVGTGPLLNCADIGFGGVGHACSSPGMVCNMPFACCNGNAKCTNGVWTAEEPLCNEACAPCGPSSLSCHMDAICVIDQFDTATTYQCKEALCGTEPFLCECAAQLCKEDKLECAGTMLNTVLCDCPTC
ncbi:MAG: hypothetical protein U0414_18770 [Polyangiaceae bacterium]